MKIWQIECNETHYNNKCGGLLVGVFASILEVKGFKPHKWCVCGQQW